MPVYEYQCEKCNKKFEISRKVTDEEGEIVCPSCGGKECRRVYRWSCSSGDSTTNRYSPPVKFG